MAFEFHLPDIGEGLTEATVVRWLCSVGDEVGTDQPIVELETDKAVVEIPAPVAGTILHLGAAEGETIPVESLLVVIGDAGERWAPGEGRREPVPTPSASPAPVRSDAAAPIVGTLEEAGDDPVGVYPDHRPGPRHNPLGLDADAEPGDITPALPLVRRFAASLGVDLATVRGTGPGGRVTRQDVEAAARSTGDLERVRMNPTRLAISRNLTRSWHEIPHVTTYGEADAVPLLERRKEWAAGSGSPVPLEALLIEKVVPVLQAHPEFNAAVDGDDVLFKKTFDLGFAVDTANGLMVAVVHGADGMDVPELGAEIARLAEAAKGRTITVAEMRGATFTISNIGAVGGRFGTPIIPYGTSAILSIGRADEQPVVLHGEVAVGRRFPLSLSYDHRIIDGATGRAFMAALIEAFEAG